MGKIKVVRVVIDTNVLISALLFGGIPGRLILLWKSARIQPLASQEMIDEVLRVLAYPKFSLSPEEIEFLLYEEILPWFEIVATAAGSPLIADDPSDDMFLWCARDGKADWIISGDEHLLQLRDFEIPILSPRQFIEWIEVNS
jgi:putative PIN family toxin of toxin-antitoxin system